MIWINPETTGNDDVDDNRVTESRHYDGYILPKLPYSIPSSIKNAGKHSRLQQSVDHEDHPPTQEKIMDDVKDEKDNPVGPDNPSIAIDIHDDRDDVCTIAQWLSHWQILAIHKPILVQVLHKPSLLLHCCYYMSSR
jgi:hypothetical protein